VREAYEVLSHEGLRQKYDYDRKKSKLIYDSYKDERNTPYKNDNNVGREWRSFRRNDTRGSPGPRFEEKYYERNDDYYKFKEELSEALRARQRERERGFKV